MQEMLQAWNWLDKPAWRARSWESLIASLPTVTVLYQIDPCYSAAATAGVSVQYTLIGAVLLEYLGSSLPRLMPRASPVTLGRGDYIPCLRYLDFAAIAQTTALGAGVQRVRCSSK
ncbi:MAG: hypothetical protein GPOALKHO_000454 [Sodalis sp.]|nr:MAG: hypothetical protein GPOALKHO_000454 [Sodalis sp.]